MSFKKCKAKTSKDKPCSNKAVEGSDYCHIKSHQSQSGEASLTNKQQRFVEEYCIDYNATQAAIRVGYSKKTAQQIGSENLLKPVISEAIKKRMQNLAMTSDEAIKRLADWGRGTASPFYRMEDSRLVIDLTTEEAQNNMHLIKKVKANEFGVVTEIELHDQKDAVDKILKVLGSYAPDKVDLQSSDGTMTPKGMDGWYDPNR